MLNQNLQYNNMFSDRKSNMDGARSRIGIFYLEKEDEKPPLTLIPRLHGPRACAGSL